MRYDTHSLTSSKGYKLEKIKRCELCVPAGSRENRSAPATELPQVDDRCSSTCEHRSEKNFRSQPNQCIINYYYRHASVHNRIMYNFNCSLTSVQLNERYYLLLLLLLYISSYGKMNCSRLI